MNSQLNFAPTLVMQQAHFLLNIILMVSKMTFWYRT